MWRGNWDRKLWLTAQPCVGPQQMPLPFCSPASYSLFWECKDLLSTRALDTHFTQIPALKLVSGSECARLLGSVGCHCPCG